MTRSPQPPQPNKRYCTRARVFRRVLLLFGLYLGVCGGIAWVSVAPHRGGVANTPRAYNMEYENVQFRSADGVKLSGWLVPAKGRTRGVVALCHGVDGNRTAMLEPAAMLNRHGFACLLFDFRARGMSGGSKSTLGWKETDDLVAAIRYLKSRPDMAGLAIGAMGHSMGGAVALMAAARCPDICAVVAESPFSQLDHAVSNHFRNVFRWLAPLFCGPSRWIGERIIGTSCAQIAPVKEIGRIAPRPVMLIEDEADDLCPPAETQALYDACGEPKSIWKVPAAGHIQAIRTQPAEFERRIVDFFNRSMPAAQHHAASGGSTPHRLTAMP